MPLKFTWNWQEINLTIEKVTYVVVETNFTQWSFSKKCTHFFLFLLSKHSSSIKGVHVVEKNKVGGFQMFSFLIFKCDGV
jgi:hypothetical protein